MAGVIGFLHTSLILVPAVRDLARRLLPDVETFHAVDEALLRDVLRAGSVTPNLVRRVARLALNAQEGGASVIVLTCSSASPSVALLQAMLNVPFLAIDEAMAEQAVAMGTRIGVIATVRTTIGPTRALLESKAAACGRKVEILSEVSADAFDAVMRGDRVKHDALVSRVCHELAGKVEVILFAQGSMAPLAEQVQPEIPVPILTSLEVGVRRAGEVLRAQTVRG
jgi:Asp/Glu/hydantoin racemase